MPYIAGPDRESLENGRPPETAGELNYVITRLVQGYIARKGGIRYDLIASVTGVLANVSQEFYRRAAAPYEDHKIRENGDVY